MPGDSGRTKRQGNRRDDGTTSRNQVKARVLAYADYLSFTLLPAHKTNSVS